MNFQEAYRRARRIAQGKPENTPAKAKKEKRPKVEKPDIAKRVKEVIKARKVKKLEDGYVGKPERDMFIGKGDNLRQTRRLPTKVDDLSQKLPVRIDAKTVVYVKPGTDIEAIKDKYKKPPLERMEFYRAAKGKAKGASKEDLF